MTEHTVPKTTEQATAMLERFATIADEIATIASTRNAAIADANAVADKALEPLLKEQATIAEKVQPWWKRASAKLLPKDRKSMELGGCTIGNKKAADTLAAPENTEAAVAALGKFRWAKKLLTTKVSLDRAAILKAVDGMHADALKALGLSRKVGEDAFVLKRAEQQGTRA